jgi:hypothetical protein
LRTILGLHRLKRDKRGVSNVIVVVLSLVIVSILVANVVLWSYQMNQLDWERLQEKIEITNVRLISLDTIYLAIQNKGSIPLHVIAIWISNNTLHERILVDFYVDSGQTVTQTVTYTIKINEFYTIKAVTERGNIATFSANFTASNRAMIAYGEAAISIPRYRIWNGVAWNVGANSFTASSTIEWIVLKSNPTKNEKILGVLSSAGYLDVSVWNGDTDVWATPIRVASVGTTLDNYRPFDIAYEQVSGKGIIVYNPSSTGTKPQYRIWNGTSWTNPQEIDVTTTGVIYWIKLASKPKSNEIALISLDSNRDVYGIVWNGTHWQNGMLLEDSASIATRECIAVEYMQASGNAMFTWGSGTFVYSRIWNEAAWGSELSGINIGGTCNWFSLKADPNSNRLVLVSVDGSQGLNTLRWDGANWILDPKHDDQVETSASRCADAEFETLQGHEGHIILVWGDLNQDSITYKHFDGTTWSAAIQISLSSFPTTDQQWHVLRRCIDGKILIACLDDGRDINTGYWDGAEWIWTDEIELVASTATMQCFDLSPDNYFRNCA